MIARHRADAKARHGPRATDRPALRVPNCVTSRTVPAMTRGTTGRLWLLFGLCVAGCPDGEPMLTTATTGPTGGPTGTSGGVSTTMTTGEPTSGPAPTTGATSSTTASVTGSTGTTAATSTDTDDTDTGTTATSTTTGTTGTTSGGMMNCTDLPPVPAGPEVVIAPEFAEFYQTFELGQVPGIPPAARLGGCVISNEDPNIFFIAGDSEAAAGKIYAIEVVRGDCDHIVGFKGTATAIADTPYVDANLLLVESGLMFYTAWPVNQISQLLPGAMAPAVTTEMDLLGVESSVSGLGFVPPGFTDPGGLRTITWPGGKWYHLDRAPSGDVFTLSNPQQTAVLPHGPGGFAYVPKGSPGFMVDHLIVSEWSADTVGVYAVDAQGDPVPATRKDFYTTFPGPWGAYFEPLTGDFIFLTWGIGNDRVYIVQGFEPPPPIPQ